MKLLIQLTSLVLFSIALNSAAESSGSGKIYFFLQQFEQQIGRELTTEETEQIGNMILAEKSNSLIQKAAATVESPVLNMACAQVQLSAPMGRMQGLSCLSANFTSYTILIAQYDSPGILVVPLALSYVRIEGPAVTKLANDPTAQKLGVPFGFKGITSSAYLIGGGDMSYFEDNDGSTAFFTGIGIGVGISIGGTGIRKEEGPIAIIHKVPERTSSTKW